MSVIVTLLASIALILTGGQCIKHGGRILTGVGILYVLLGNAYLATAIITIAR